MSIPMVVNTSHEKMLVTGVINPFDNMTFRYVRDMLYKPFIKIVSWLQHIFYNLFIQFANSPIEI